MKILVIEPLNHWHWNLDAYFITVFNSFAEVTLVAPEGYLPDAPCVNRVSIPRSLYTPKSMITKRLVGLKVLQYIKNKINFSEFDATIFLSYELIPTLICWPHSRKIMAFEHNVIDSVDQSRVKRWIYKHMSKFMSGIVFQESAKKYLDEKFQRDAYYVPHPYYNIGSDGRDITTENQYISHVSDCNSPLILGSLSGNTPQKINNELKKMVAELEGKYFLFVKSWPSEQKKYYRAEEFFDDYLDVLKKCDVIFIGGLFHYRVSGVAYEAISLGKPIIMFDCKFSQELKQMYPSLITIINSLEEIEEMNFNWEMVYQNWMLFLEEHSFSKICQSVKDIWNVPE